MTWQRIWQNRELPGEEPVSLAAVMALDGFEAVDPEDWSAGVARIRERLGADAGDTIFDVGCGAGAFLYPFVHRFGHTVGGLDYSEAQIANARRAMPGMPFTVQEANGLDVEVPYDFVVAHSTFQYFPSLDYAADVLRRMLAKARKAVAVLDVNDAARQQDLESLRRGRLPVGEYEERYRGLDHLYYHRDWFQRFGVAEIFEQDIPTYATSGLRFNVILRR